LNLRRFLAAATGVMIGSLSMLKDAQESQCSKRDYVIRGWARQRGYFVRCSENRKD